MSDLYEAVLAITDSQTACDCLIDVSTPLQFRLIRFDDNLYGYHRIATRDDRFEPEAIIRFSCKLSKKVGQTLAMFYDNRCGINFCHLYRTGAHVRSFDEEDALWVRTNEDGQPDLSSEHFTVDQLKEDDEYECLQSAIDIGQRALGLPSPMSISALTNAFCYNQCDVLAENRATEP